MLVLYGAYFATITLIRKWVRVMVEEGLGLRLRLRRLGLRLELGLRLGWLEVASE